MDDDKTRTYKVLSAGTRISHYEIIKRIGAGGMGEVYLAEDTSLHRKVALKFMPAQWSSDEELRKRFAGKRHGLLVPPPHLHLHNPNRSKG